MIKDTVIRVGVVGDIHGNYEGLERVVERLGRIEMLLFTGDGYREIDKLTETLRTPVVGVAGNCDLVTEYPAEQTLFLRDTKILLTHGHIYGVKNGLTRLGLAARAAGAQLVVFGHTHQPLVDNWQEINLLNPGSLSGERSYRGPSYGVIEVSPAGIKLSLERL